MFDRKERFISGRLDAEPRYRCPIGVRFSYMKEEETNSSPVLVCEVCNSPKIHGPAGADIHGQWKCLDCGRWRRW